MLKTNCKKTREKIRALISDLFDASSYDREDLNSASTEEKIKFIASTCWEELGHEVERCGSTYQEMFIDWCEGLPSLLDTSSYYLHSAVKMLGDILEETEQERSKYTEEQAESTLSYLIYKEVADDLFRVAF